MIRSDNKYINDGWLLIDKDVGIGSTSVINKLKHIIRPNKIGHGGTLDPLASGILPVAINQATKTVEYCMDKRKEYVFEVTWGRETTTDDLEGEFTNSSDIIPTTQQIISIIPDFIGGIMQIPPIFSAIKQDGVRLYEHARNNNHDIDIKGRVVEIYELELLKHSNVSSKFRVSCGRGTYVRSLARDMGRKIGCYGYVTELRRTKIGKYGVDDTISLEKIKDLLYTNQLAEFLLPVYALLDDIPALNTSSECEVLSIRQGKVIELHGLDSLNNGIVSIRHNNNLIAIGDNVDGIFKSRRVFN